MNKETIEQAAEAYVMGNSASYVECFEAGAKWRINSVWHEVNEEPDPDGGYTMRSQIRTADIFLLNCRSWEWKGQPSRPSWQTNTDGSGAGSGSSRI